MSNYENPENVIGKIDKTKTVGEIDIRKKKERASEGKQIERKDPQNFQECFNMGICPACYFQEESKRAFVDSMRALTTEGCCTRSQYDRYTNGVPLPKTYQSVMAERNHRLEQLRETYGKEEVDDLERESTLQSWHYLTEQIGKILEEKRIGEETGTKNEEHEEKYIPKDIAA